MKNLSRRDFFKSLTNLLLTMSGGLGIVALFHFLDHSTEPSIKTAFDIGSEESYPIGSRSIHPDVPAVLIHNQSGFTALSLVCTHLGCTVEEKDNDFTCPCHGSQYDANGNVLRGPAQKPLRTLRVEITSDRRLILHTD